MPDCMTFIMLTINLIYSNSSIPSYLLADENFQANAWSWLKTQLAKEYMPPYIYAIEEIVGNMSNKVVRVI